MILIPIPGSKSTKGREEQFRKGKLKCKKGRQGEKSRNKLFYLYNQKKKLSLGLGKKLSTTKKLNDITYTLQHEKINMAVYFWYLIKSDLSSVRNFNTVHWTSFFIQGTRYTQPCITGHPVVNRSVSTNLTSWKL